MKALSPPILTGGQCIATNELMRATRGLSARESLARTSLAASRQWHTTAQITRTLVLKLLPLLAQAAQDS